MPINKRHNGGFWVELEPKPQLLAYGGYVGTREEMYRLCPFVKGLPEDMQAELEEEGAQNYERLITENPQKANDLYEQTRTTIAEPDEKQEVAQANPKQANEASKDTFGGSRQKETESQPVEPNLPSHLSEPSVRQPEDSQLVPVMPIEPAQDPVVSTDSYKPEPATAHNTVGDLTSNDVVRPANAEERANIDFQASHSETTFKDIDDNRELLQEEAIVRTTEDAQSIQEVVLPGETSAEAVQRAQLISEEFVDSLILDTEHVELQEVVDERFDALFEDFDEMPETADELFERITEEFSEDDEIDVELLALLTESNELLKELGIEDPTTEQLIGTAKNLALQAAEALEPQEVVLADETSDGSQEQEQEPASLVGALDEAVIAKMEASPEKAEEIDKLRQELKQIAEFVVALRAGQAAEQLTAELTAGEQGEMSGITELIEHPALQGITEEQLTQRLETVLEQLLDMLEIRYDKKVISPMVAELLRPKKADEQDVDVSQLSVEEREKLGMRNFKYGLTFTQLSADVAALQAALHIKLGTAALKQSNFDLAA